MADAAAVAQAVRDGSARAAARVISWAENRDPRAGEALGLLHAHTGNAQVVGITGPPGSGKSTLVDKLADAYRKAGRTVGVLAVDPTSPFTGGAVLADRIRMGLRSTDPEVFVRSMGSRGALGGLAPAIHDAVRVLDAMGKEVILIETVGVGQGEVDIVRTADTVVLVAVPGLGDDIQNIKAGIMEIADVFAVNKADLDGVDRTIAELESHLRIAYEGSGAGVWRPPIVRTTARDGTGIPELVEAVQAHLDDLARGEGLAARRRQRVEHELLALLKERLVAMVFDEDRVQGTFRALVDDVLSGKRPPRAAADELLDRWEP